MRNVIRFLRPLKVAVLTRNGDKYNPQPSACISVGQWVKSGCLSTDYFKLGTPSINENDHYFIIVFIICTFFLVYLLAPVRSGRLMLKVFNDICLWPTITRVYTTEKKKTILLNKLQATWRARTPQLQRWNS